MTSQSRRGRRRLSESFVWCLFIVINPLLSTSYFQPRRATEPRGDGSSGRLGSVVAPVLLRLYLSVSLFVLSLRPDLHRSFLALGGDGVSLYSMHVFCLICIFVHVTVAKFVGPPRPSYCKRWGYFSSFCISIFVTTGLFVYLPTIS